MGVKLSHNLLKKQYQIADKERYGMNISQAASFFNEKKQGTIVSPP